MGLRLGLRLRFGVEVGVEVEVWGVVEVGVEGFDL